MSISEFWDEDEFDIDTILPLAVPDAESAIHHFAAFTRGNGEEMEVIDWDQGVAFARYPTFEAFLGNLLEAQEAVVRRALEASVERSRDEETAPKSPIAALFALDDLAQIQAAIGELAIARPSTAQLQPYFETLGRELWSATPRTFARAELAFHPQLAVPTALRELWVTIMSNAISSAFGKVEPKRLERWAEMRAIYAKLGARVGVSWRSPSRSSRFALQLADDDASTFVGALPASIHLRVDANRSHALHSLTELLRDESANEELGSSPSCDP